MDASKHRAKFRQDIEGLRGLAVLLVVAYHAAVPGISGGFVGVDVFFVLSGYLITGLLLDEHERTGRIALAAFFARRVRRLLPASAFLILAIMVIAALIQDPFEQAARARTAVAASAYVTNVWLGRKAGDYFAPQMESDPLLHMWSLSVEEQFYLIWPFLLLTLLWAARGHRGRATLGLLLFAALSYLAAFWYTYADPTAAFYYTPLRGWEFAVGGLLAAVRPTPMPGWARRMSIGAGAAAVLGSAMWLDPNSAFPGPGAVPVVMGTLLMLAPGHTGASTGRVLRSRALQHLGRLSYGWYLWHWLAIVFTRSILHEADWHVLLLSSALALLAAEASYRWVEGPVRYHRWLSASPWRSLGFGAVVSLLMIGAGSANVLRVHRWRPVV